WGWLEHLLAKPELASFASGLGTQIVGAAQGHEEVGHAAHNIAMVSSIAIAGLGILLSTLVYYWKKISAEVWGKRLKPIYTLLWNKYYFDELYSATVIALTLLISRISALFDMKVIDGVVNGVARATAGVSVGNGRFDLKIIDGLVNLVGGMIAFFGAQLRLIQTGRIQSYILMALAAVLILFFIQQF
ncbi:MAG: NADH-quinone oxidoreductase subunit L, partial [bacterium]